MDKKKKKCLTTHLLLLGLIVLYMVIVTIAGIGCPIRYVIGYPCPGCGLTRAWLSLVLGKPLEAFSYHPLFLLAPILVFAAVHQGTPVMRRIPKWAVNALLGIGCSAFIVVYLLRMFVFHNIAY